MFIKNLGVNEEGNLTFSGHDTVKIAKEYGTPLYVMDVNLIRKNCRKFKNIMEKYCKNNSLVCFAS